MQLFGYWRSSAAYRVRIVMHLKGVEFDSKSVHLVKNGGEQHHPDYVDLNPTHLVPTLVDGDFTLNQSMAIIDYLDAKYPDVSLYPADIQQASLTKALAYDIACEVHPLNNLRVQQYLVGELDITDDQKAKWVNYWMTIGFKAFEQQLAKTSGKYCVGNEITMADVCLIPQIYNAKRFGVDLTAYPLINQVVEHCEQHPAFIKARPENQHDAQ